ncbi:MAG: heparinase II/III family protein [Candidatus Kryptoniota bacterium]
MLEKILKPKDIIDLLHREKDKTSLNLTEFKEKLRSRFFLSDASRKEFYIVLMSSTAGFDAIMDDADLVHDAKLLTLPNFSPLDQKRMHHLIWLGKAYWVSSSEQHTDRLKSEISDFLKTEHNKSWFDSIDSKIALINVITSLLYFLKSPYIDDKFLIEFLSSLFKIGRKLKKSLRATDGSTNYCAGLVAILFIGLVFLDTKDGKKLTKWSFDALQKHILEAVLKDGTHSSRDINCHLLSTELLTTAYILLRLNGYKLSDSYVERLELMYDFLDSASDKSGRCHLAGIRCNGRLFRTMSQFEISDVRDLMAIGAAIFNRDDFRTRAMRYSDLALMLLGSEGYESFSALSPVETCKSKVFKEGHFAFLRSEQNWASFDFGLVKRKTNVSSGYPMNFTVSGRNDFILNLGTNGNTLPDTMYSGRLVLMCDDAKPGRFVLESSSLVSVDLGNKEDIVEVENVLRTKKQRFFHRRRLSFNKFQRSILIEDTLSGEGKCNINMPLYFHPDLRVTRIGRNTLTLEGEEFAFLKIDNDFVLMDEPGTQPKSLLIKWSGILPFKSAIFVFITGNLDDLNHIINTSK